MFPHLSFRFTGLETETEYNVLVDMVLADPNQWKFSSGKWSMCGPSDGISKCKWLKELMGMRGGEDGGYE